MKHVKHDPLLLFFLTRVTQIPMRVPISKLHDAEQQAGSSTAIQTSSGELQRPASNAGELQRSASNEALKIVPVASKDTLPPWHEKPQFHQEENGKKVTEAMATEEAFHDSHIFGGKSASLVVLLVWFCVCAQKCMSAIAPVSSPPQLQ